MLRMHYGLLTAALLFACADATEPLLAPDRQTPAFTPAYALNDTDNGDGTHTVVLQPGPGANDGTDQGTTNAGKDALAFYYENYPHSDLWHNYTFASNCNGMLAFSLYRFDLADLPPGADVVSAQVQLYSIILMGYGWPYQINPTPVKLSPLLGPWEENAVTWSTVPARGEPIATASLTTPTYGYSTNWSGTTYNVVFEGWVTFDITPLYLQWSSGAATNHGVAYERSSSFCENGNAHEVVSSDIAEGQSWIVPVTTAMRPKLVVRYHTGSTGGPTAVPGGPYAGAEGSVVAFDGSGSSDPDGGALSYAWDFGDGATGTGATPQHAYAQSGEYTVSLTVMDDEDAVGSAQTTATITNVAPVVNAGPDRHLPLAQPLSQHGSFADPGGDTWMATVDYGDGSGTGALPLAGKGFDLAHAYGVPGLFTVTVRVTDGDGDVGADLVYVRVYPAGQSPQELLQQLIALVVARRDARQLRSAEAGSMLAKLQNAARQLDIGENVAAVNMLAAFEKEVGAVIGSSRVLRPVLQPCLDLSSRIRGLLVGS